jgi:hypothetical protein
VVLAWYSEEYDEYLLLAVDRPVVAYHHFEDLLAAVGDLGGLESVSWHAL